MPGRSDRRRSGRSARVRNELERVGLRPSRGKGQSFLTDADVAERQVLSAGVAPGDDVLEVGGGLGILTAALSQHGARVRVLEIEPALAAELSALQLPGVTVEESDALTAKLGSPQKVVANVPYSISTRLVERLVRANPELMVLLLQREFAERIAARPGGKSWSRLGAIVQRDYTVEILERVPPNAFAPQPEVHSAVVRLTRRPGERRSSGRDYRFLLRRLFASRRKKVRNTVVAAAAHFQIDPEHAVEEAERLGVADRRPEELSCDDFEALCVALASRRSHK